MEQLRQTDRRRDRRLPGELEQLAVYLDNRSEPLHFEAGDISAGGVFLQTGPVVLPLNALVGLTFSICGREQRVLAVVKRRTRSGAGLVFVNSRSEIARMLRALLPLPAA